MREFKSVVITPKMAENYLKGNLGNRPKRQEKILIYSNEMINGRWKPKTGEPIKLSSDGKLLDGQNRLYSIIKAGIPVEMDVVTGISEDVFDVLDTGALRSRTDVFNIKNIKNASTIPSIISTYMMFKKGGKDGTKCDITRTEKPTNTTLLEAYYERELFWQNVANKTHTWYLSFGKIIQPSILGGFYAFFYDIHSGDAENFFDQVTTGVNISNESINILRQRLLQDRVAVRTMPQSHRNAFIIKTWNSYRKNEKIKILKFDVERDSFPIAV